VAHNITLIRGDGIGPEVAGAARRVLDATGAKITWEPVDAGVDAIDIYGMPLPDSVVESIRRNKVALKGPITTPVGAGFRSINLALRRMFDLFVCVRPCKIYPGAPSRYTNVDFVVIRENTEDLYAGIEFDVGTDEAERIIEMAGGRIRHDAAISIKPISAHASRRVIQFAFEYAVRYGRKRVTAVAMANLMKYTDGLFLRVAEDVAESYRGKVEYEWRLLGNLLTHLVQHPEQFDVLVLPNLYGDVVSEVGAGLIGGAGVAPGAGYGDEYAMFEATHGSVPKYKGLNKADPTGMILSGAMMLAHIGETEAAERVERAVAKVIAEGKRTTFDMKPDRADPSAVGTSEMADAVIEALSVV
jgi:isocitrate dehydrogenase (NAD+)